MSMIQRRQNQVTHLMWEWGRPGCDNLISSLPQWRICCPAWITYSLWREGWASTWATEVEGVRIFHSHGQWLLYRWAHVLSPPIQPNKFRFWDFCLSYQGSRFVLFRGSQDWENMGTEAIVLHCHFLTDPKFQQIRWHKVIDWVLRSLYESWVNPCPSPCIFWIYK